MAHCAAPAAAKARRVGVCAPRSACARAFAGTYHGSFACGSKILVAYRQTGFAQQVSRVNLVFMGDGTA